ncbi:M23 family metallopeptidase [Sediminibacillus albus]|uniref:Stage II sporulation protein Q n=1 Tax=Sediminibacillus albus TaxID=407036 RepID=A0A1G8ZI55_9BACI|nr:M23 family metallopeptidase [Sediminibacillus albus]SDK14751.1 stage II sporulation protein Q [Sediminibacillus albus]
MREENKNVSKNGWKRIFRKKWFFPALYLTMAALLLTGVLWYQNLDTPDQALDNNEPQVDNISENPFDMGEEAEPVVEQQEVIKMPVQEEDQAEIVTKFYDYSADSEDQEKALVLYNNKYYQSTGVDIASPEGESFDVTASLSGEVIEVKEDPLLGNVVKLSHQNDVTTYYASLDKVSVEAGSKVQQGDVIGTAGKNLFGQASGTHVHFELRQGENPVNPEEFFNRQLNELKSESSNGNEADAEDKAAEDSSSAEEEAGTEGDSSTEKEAETEGNSSTEDSPDTEEDSENESGDSISEESSADDRESSAAMANA